MMKSTGKEVRWMALLLLGVTACAAVEEIPAPDEQEGTDYCLNQFQCRNQKNFACDHKVKSSGKLKVKRGTGYLEGDCSDMVTVVSPKQRGVFLEAMNDFRNSDVARLGASNIRQLTWDYELEKFAKILGTNLNIDDEGMGLNADRWAFSVCAKTILGSSAGIFYFGANKEPPDTVVDYWHNYTGTDLIDKFPAEIETSRRAADGPGKYTWAALSWATASKAGCAYTVGHCTLANHPAGNYTIVVCFIAGGVNKAGNPVFKRGKPCSNCPKNSACKPDSQWPNLCAKARDPTKTSDIPDSAPSIYLLTLMMPLLIIVPLLF